MMTDPVEDQCERCGEYRQGTRRWMFYGDPLIRFPRLPIGREFYCHSCNRIMKVYAVIGFTLVAIVVGAIVVATIWLNSSIPNP